MPAVGATRDLRCLRRQSGRSGVTRPTAPRRQGTHVNRTHPRRRQALILAAARHCWQGAWPQPPAPRLPRSPQARTGRPQGRQGRDRAVRRGPRARPGSSPEDLAKRARQKRDAALQRMLEGKNPYPKGVGPAKRVPLELEGTDRVFVVLAEFGDLRHPAFCDAGGSSSRRPTQPCQFPSDPDAAAVRRPAAQPDPGPGPLGRQLHALAARLQPRALRGHVLQPDEGVLRAPVLGSLLDRRATSPSG